jgi:hypothetical protein
MACIPTAVGLATYQGDEKDFVNSPLEEMVQQNNDWHIKLQFGQDFSVRRDC